MSSEAPLDPAARAGLTTEIFQRCDELGFALAGITSAKPVARGHELRAWLQAGRHGEMVWMERHADQRVNPSRKLEGARSVIVAADRYADASPDENEHGVGRIARYARGEDYHLVMKKRLHQLTDELKSRFVDGQFVACVDTAPVLERELAERAGIGYVGKNTMLIEPGVGSYLLLGEIITTLDLDTSGRRILDHCGDCTRCLEACPTDALTPYSLDATRCISYLTIEHRSVIDHKFHQGIGDWIFGCDICQEVCPHNGDTEPTRHAPLHPAYEPRRTGLNLLEVLGWTEEDRRSAFARSALKRAKLEMMKRNALIAAGKSLSQKRDPELERRIAEINRDESESDLVRKSAEQVIQRLDLER